MPAVLDDYDDLDATALAERVRSGAVGAADAVEAAIARIEQRDGALNAVVHRMFEQARRAARGPLPDGRFRGVPILLKDIQATLAGEPMRSGSRAYDDWRPPRSSEVVRRLLAGGFVVVGKSATPEFALTPVTEPEAFGPTRNPWNPARTAGGSSGGSAASVAARMVPVASGGDGGGSIRIPASCCGVFGLKPSRGRVPTGPDEGEVWEGFSSEHVLTRSVRDSAAVLDLIAGPMVGEPYALPAPPRRFADEIAAPPARLRIGVTRATPLSDAVHPDCVAALDDAAALARSLGHEIVEVPALDAEWGAAWKQAIAVMMAGICAADVRDAEARTGRRPRRALFDRTTWMSRAIGESFSAGAYAHARRTLQRLARRIAEQVATVDVWLTPTLGEPPLPIGELYSKGAMARVEEVMARLQLGGIARRSPAFAELVDRVFRFMPFTMPINAAGLPSMSVPLHWNAAGLPIGVMFTGQMGDDATLLRLAAQLDAARPWRARRPG